MVIADPDKSGVPDLEYVALALDDPEHCARFLEGALGLHRAERRLGDRSVPVVALGRSALALFHHQDPFLGGDARKGVHHIAIAAEDPRQASFEAGLAMAQDTVVGAGLDGRRQIILQPALTCGVRTRLTEPLGIPGGRSRMVERIDHVGVASNDNQAAKGVFIDRLSCAYESEQTDSEFETISEQFASDRHPMVFHTRPSLLRGSLRVTFITLGDCELEFLQDVSGTVVTDAARHDRPGNTRGDRSAIARFVGRHGQGLHHLALKTDDIDSLLRHLIEAGCRVIDRVGRPGSRRARIGFVHPSATGGVLLHFVEREEI